MLIGFLNVLFVILCFFIIFIVLLQKSKGSLGLVGSIGSASILLGGSGGQDVFQKMTWIAVALFMGGSLGLAILKNRSAKEARYLVDAIAASAVASSVVPQQGAVQPQAAVPVVPPVSQEPSPEQKN